MKRIAIGYRYNTPSEAFNAPTTAKTADTIPSPINKKIPIYKHIKIKHGTEYTRKLS